MNHKLNGHTKKYPEVRVTQMVKEFWANKENQKRYPWFYRAYQKQKGITNENINVASTSGSDVFCGI